MLLNKTLLKLILPIPSQAFHVAIRKVKVIYASVMGIIFLLDSMALNREIS